MIGHSSVCVCVCVLYFFHRWSFLLVKKSGVLGEGTVIRRYVRLAHAVKWLRALRVIKTCKTSENRTEFSLYRLKILTLRNVHLYPQLHPGLSYRCPLSDWSKKVELLTRLQVLLVPIKVEPYQVKLCDWLCVFEQETGQRHPDRAGETRALRCVWLPWQCVGLLTCCSLCV